MPKFDLDTRIAALEAQLDEDRNVAVARLRFLREQRARELLGIDADGRLLSEVSAAVERGPGPETARAAIAQLRAAEERQWEIGTWATAGAEGLASMSEVRVLQLAQAWLWSALASEDEAARVEARRLCDEVESDPNRLGERHRRTIEALRRRLDEPPH